VAGTHIHQAFIGTCTNGRLEDLAAAAEVLRSPAGHVHRVAPGTRLIVIPASSEVLRDALSAGYIETFLAAGAMLGTPGCGPCMGNHLGVPASGEVVLSSSNRNFRGRMGNPDSYVYLASPAVVAASAVFGKITDPRELLTEAQLAESPPSTLALAAHRETVAVTVTTAPGRPEPVTMRLTSQPGDQEAARSVGRAPGEPAENPAVPPDRRLTGRAWKYGDDVNTDVIYPGKYTYTVTDEAEMARHALEDLDPEFATRVAAGDIIVGGRNWGCGSSREQAVTCLKAAGVKAIVAASFARIYYRNALNNSLLPVVCPDAAAAIESGETVTLDLGRSVVRCASGEFEFQPLSASAWRIIEAGGLLEMLRARAAEIRGS
jgi:3-isopropylmalate/(R)-2-methylmalate dehydratase small subunit